MRIVRTAAIAILLLLLASSVAVNLVTGASHSTQHRETPGAGPSARFPLGTDELGRDRLLRLLEATRYSLLLAPASAAAATVLALAIGGLAGYCGGVWDRCVARAIDLTLSLPWLFLLLAVRGWMPLNVSPATSLAMTYGLLAALGWAAPARVLRAGARALRDADFVLHARALGCSRTRVLIRYVAPNLKPVLLAQFWTSIPVFILAEATLGLLGLSAGEPIPTWGNLLRELQNPFPPRLEVLAQLAVVALSVCCLKYAVPMKESRT
jgi:peptide/nickel transport system permease protein